MERVILFYINLEHQFNLEQTHIHIFLDEHNSIYHLPSSKHVKHASSCTKVSIHSAAPWIINLATFFWSPGGRPSALRAAFLTAAICTVLPQLRHVYIYMYATHRRPPVFAARDGFACQNGLDDRPVLHYYIGLAVIVSLCQYMMFIYTLPW